MVFGDALEKMKAGAKTTRRGWFFPVCLYVAYTKASLQPYLVVQAPGHEAMPYTATHTDLFADVGRRCREFTRTTD